MSLAINVDQVGRVLLVDGWHDVAKNAKGISSFDIDAYEYVRTWINYDREKTMLLLGGGEDNVSIRGFMFLNDAGQWVMGPVSSILAVSYRE